jgi:2-amino-4-hydroxy-6-hydroxymethyldihydropteridine diphosphokinase
MHTAYLLLGANLGERLATIERALAFIEASVGAVVGQSSMYQTAPWGNTQQPPFLNQVVQVKTQLRPAEVLAQILTIEKQLGRVRTQHWGARLIDIDILYYDHLMFQTDELNIPHPHLHERRFTLVPLVEIAPHYIHPTIGQSNQWLLDNCLDMSDLQKL